MDLLASGIMPSLPIQPSPMATATTHRLVNTTKLPALHNWHLFMSYATLWLYYWEAGCMYTPSERTVLAEQKYWAQACGLVQILPPEIR